jgi:hypothetical protein
LPNETSFTSNNISLGYDQYAVLDPEVMTGQNATFWFNLYAQYNFGKFAGESYPWLWWEPR